MKAVNIFLILVVVLCAGLIGAFISTAVIGNSLSEFTCVPKDEYLGMPFGYPEPQWFVNFS